MSTIATETVTIDNDTLALWVKDGDRYEDWDLGTIETAVGRVNRGALLLDEKNPAWMDMVVPAKLDMSSARFCIIGQAYGDYDDHVAVPFGMNVIDDDDDDRSEVNRKAIEHGFMDNGVPFELLDRVWVYLLTERAHYSKRVTLELP